MEKLLIDNEQFVDERLDKYLSSVLSEYSRTKIGQFIEEGIILINDKCVRPSYRLKINDEVTINDFPKETSTLKAQDIPLDIVYEDEEVIVINKSVGMVTHPGAGNYENTLANALSFYAHSLSSVNGEFRPGIVHRLDKDTSGLLVVAKNDAAHLFLQEQLKDHTLGRRYFALALGTINEEEGKIIAPIGRDKKNRLKMAVDLINGKDATTNFKVVKRYKDYTFVECILETGRTHQIRVHFDYIKHPIVGDPLYGKGNRIIYKDGQLLFAHHLSFIHPKTKKKLDFEAPLPTFFKDILTKLD